MSELYNLDYFDGIFEEKGESYCELLDTLTESLTEFSAEYQKAVLERDEKRLAFVRHRSVTLVENLQLLGLKPLLAESKSLMEGPASVEVLQNHCNQIAHYLSQVIQGLRDERGRIIPQE